LCLPANVGVFTSAVCVTKRFTGTDRSHGPGGPRSLGWYD
jgi:hypothetical protein